MRTALRENDLELLLLEEHSDESVYAGGGFCGREMSHLHFTVFLELEHLAQTLETASKQKAGLF